MLGRLGFYGNWIRWIKGCLESSWLSILVNDSPTQEFKRFNGLRQGDSLATFLFLVVAEGLSGFMREAKAKHLFSGYKVVIKIVSLVCYNMSMTQSFLGSLMQIMFFLLKQY